jgi:hypothetical protein
MAEGLAQLPRTFAGVRVQPADLADNLKLQVVTVDVSFETNEQGTVKVYFGNRPVTVTRWHTFVTKALAGTDAGSVVIKNAAGTTMTAASGSFTTWSPAASSAYGTEGGWWTIEGNNTIAADAAAQLTVSKTTAGGKAQVQIEFKPTP